MKKSILVPGLVILSLVLIKSTILGAYPEPGNRISVFDHGLQMNIASWELPSGWSTDNYIVTATNDYTRFFTFYKFDILGNQGEVIRNFAPVKFSPYFGESVEQVWHQSIVKQIAPFGKFSGGELTQSYYGISLFPQVANVSGLQLVESYISGYRNGKAFEGVCIGFLAYGQYASQLNGVIILCPKGQLNRVVEQYRQINFSKKENPQYTQRINQLNQYKNQQYVNISQAIMKRQRSEYKSWQSSNQAAVNAYSASNSSFNDYIKGDYSSNTSGYNNYSVQDARNDHIQGVTSFNDAYMNQRVKQEGEYQYWFTNGYGEYRGTNNPGYDPATLGMNWHRAYPLQAN